jgi:hypothetical protein
MPLNITILENQKFSSNELNNTTFVARYMDFPEFLELLNRVLKFTSLKKLKEHHIFEFDFDVVKMKVDREKHENSEFTPDEIDDALQRKDWSESWFCSSWTQSRQESMALWKIFGAMGKGIRIESTVGNVKNSIRKEYWPFPIYAHRVEYHEKSRSDEIFEAIYTKRKEFRYESEVRFAGQVPFPQGKQYKGFWIDPSALLKRVVVGPEILWAFPYVRETVKRFGIDEKIVKMSKYRTE